MCWLVYLLKGVVICLLTGCAYKGDSQGGILQSVERIHSVLRSSRASHGPYVHLPRADECCILQVRAQG